VRQRRRDRDRGAGLHRTVRRHDVRLLPAVRAVVAHRDGQALTDRGEVFDVRVKAELVPLGEDVDLEPGVVGLRETVDQGGVHVAVHGEHDRCEPLLLEQDIGPDLRL
jgi:hypothetical protein